MVSVCFYFQVHQPFRLKRDFDFFSIGADGSLYEDLELTESIAKKVALKCYLPANKLLLKLINKHKGKFRIAFSISGVALEQFEKYCPEVIDSYKDLVKTGCVEMICETYYHSLASQFSKSEFRAQVRAHKKKIKDLFGVNAKTFRNTELIYNNDLAEEIEKLGFKTILAEGADQVLGWRSPNFIYLPAPCYKLNLLLKNYRLSDDIAFRFSNFNWPEYPLTASKYASWLHRVAGSGEVINLFMDYETFGEHQWEDTGIFRFLEYLPEEVLKHPDFRFKTPSEVIKVSQPISRLNVTAPVSWADQERDLSAWLGNAMQISAAEFLYSMESDILKTKDQSIISSWRKLQTSDHLYYMSTKNLNDGAVHNYFNPFDNPYDAFVTYSNALNHLKEITKRYQQKARKLRTSTKLTSEISPSVI